MKKFFLIAILLLTFNNLFSQDVEEPDHFEQINAKLIKNVEMPNKLAIFEKVADNYIAAYFGDNDMFVFEEFDKDLNHKVISSLKINSKEYLNNYYFFGDKVLLIFDGRKNGVYAKSILFDYKTGNVINSELVYALVDPSEFDPKSWNESIPYQIKDNKDVILLKDFNKNSFNLRKLQATKTFHNSKTNSILMYNFIESENGNLDVYYSIIDKNGKLIFSERVTLQERAFDKNRITNGIYGELNEDDKPIFYVDWANDNKRFVSAFNKVDNKFLAITTDLPVEINGETDFAIKSLHKIENTNYIIGLINENKDDFSATYGIVQLNYSANERKLNLNIVIWTEEEIEKMTNDNKLSASMISDIIYKNDEYFLILEANEVYNVYEQNMYIPVNELRDGLILKLDKNLKHLWSHYIKNRDIKRIVSCDNKSKVYNEPKFRYALKFDDKNIDSGKPLSFLYHDNSDEEIFGLRELNIENGNLMKDSKLFESDEMLFLYPSRVYKDNNNIIMQVSNDCDSHIVKFTF